ncbi:MAG: hypothetical protein RR588_00355 [Solibacillus sp.]
MKKPSWSEVSKLQDRAGLWTTRAMRASAKDDYNRVGDLRTKAMKLSAQAENMRKKLIELGK